MDLAVFGLGLSKKQLVGIPFAEGSQLKSSTAMFPGVMQMARRGSRLRAALANFGDRPHPSRHPIHTKNHRIPGIRSESICK